MTERWRVRFSDLYVHPYLSLSTHPHSHRDLIRCGSHMHVFEIHSSRDHTHVVSTDSFTGALVSSTSTPYDVHSHTVPIEILEPSPGSHTYTYTRTGHTVTYKEHHRHLSE